MLWIKCHYPCSCMYAICMRYVDVSWTWWRVQRTNVSSLGSHRTEQKSWASLCKERHGSNSSQHIHVQTTSSILLPVHCLDSTWFITDWLATRNNVKLYWELKTQGAHLLGTWTAETQSECTMKELANSEVRWFLLILQKIMFLQSSLCSLVLMSLWDINRGLAAGFAGVLWHIDAYCRAGHPWGSAYKQLMQQTGDGRDWRLMHGTTMETRQCPSPPDKVNTPCVRHPTVSMSVTPFNQSSSPFIPFVFIAPQLEFVTLIVTEQHLE